MSDNIKEILKKEKIYLFYDISKKEYSQIDLTFKELTTFDNFSHLFENLSFQMENLFQRTLIFKKEELGQLIIKVNGKTFQPTKNLIYQDRTKKLININFPKDFISRLDYNIDNIEPLRESFPTFLKIIGNLCENDKKSINWVLDWFSHIVRYNLGLEKKKVNTSILFYGGQGSGKNLFINGIIECFIKTKELSQKDLENPFNPYLVKNNLITFNEIQVKKGKGTMDEIKNMITCLNHSINIKGVSQFEIPNIHNYIFTSNKDVPLIIESDDRRFTIFKPIEPIINIISQKEIDVLDECLKELNEKNKYYSELVSFGNYLVNNKNLKSNIKSPFINETKKVLMTKSISLNKKFINELKTKELNEFCEEHSLDYKNYLLGVNNKQYVTTKKLLFKLYEDYYKQHSDKFEFAKRKDQILDELQENKIFIAIGNDSKNVKLITTGNYQSYRYLYHYARNKELYLDEQEPELENLNVVDELEECIL